MWILVSDDSEKSESTDDEVEVDNCLRGMYTYFQVIKFSVSELCQRMHGMSLGQYGIEGRTGGMVGQSYARGHMRYP